MPPAAARPSEAQLGLWLGHHRAIDSSIYNAAECVILRGPLDADAFVRALEATLAEATALHVAFPEQNGTPLVVPTRARTRSACIELTTASEALEATLVAHAGATIRQPFDLAEGAPFRHQLLRVSDTLHVWLHVAHHVVLDGYGFALVARRVGERYAAALEGTAPPPCWFTPLRPVLDEDAAYRDAPAREHDAAFWRTELEGRGGSCFDGSHPPAHGLRHRHAVPVASLARLREAAAHWRVAWTDVLPAIVAARLAEITRRREFVLGLPIMLRLGTAAVRTPCTAMNIACLPIEPAAARTRGELVHAVAASTLRHKAHRRFRYEHLRRGGVSAFGPVVNVMAFDGPRRFGAATAEPLAIAAGPVEDLSISFTAWGDALSLTLDGHPERFTRDDLHELGQALACDVEDWQGAPDRRLHATAAPVPMPASIEPVDPTTSLRAIARAQPHAVALVDGHRAWSYAELETAVRHCAAELLTLGVGAGTVVVIAIPRSMLAVVAMLAVWRTGAAFLVVDPRDGSARTRQSLALAKPALVVHATQTRFGTLAATPSLALGDPELAAWIASPCEREIAAPKPEANDPAYVVFTSGSTGEPKGVVVGHGALRHFVAAARASYGIRADDRVLQFAPLTFDACIEEIAVSLTTGATLVLRDDAMLESMEAFLQACLRLELSIVDLPTAFWHELVYAMTTRRLAWPRCVRMVIIGGEAASPERVREWHAAVPGTALLNTYGPSEATVVATWAELRPPTAAAVPIGVPLPGVEAIVCDAHGVPVRGPETTGELLLLGPTLALGYLGRDDLTRERFVTLPGRGRAYRTGDLVNRDIHGRLVHRGRVDDELKVSGHRIAPAEIEAVLLRDPEIRAAVVVGEPTGTGALRLVAVLEADPSRIDVEALRDRLARSLPPALVPGTIEVRESLPRTAHGKIDRATVRAAMPTVDTHVRAVSSPALELVLSAWRTVLGHAAIEPDHDFFARGGTSLQVMALASRLSASGAEIRVAEIFRNPTPRMQAVLLADPHRSRTTPAAFEPWRVDLPRMGSQHDPRPIPRDDGPVLLTGATGFLGIHVLAAWLARTRRPIVCLVRAPSLAHARARLEAHANTHGLVLADHRARIAIEAVDLTGHEGRGEALVARLPACSVVLHCAADTSVMRDYGSLAPANVLATRELLGAAMHWNAAFHLASTIAVVPTGEAVAEERLFARHAGLADGYTRSKWHAEWLCERAGAEGLAVAVHRLGRISGPRSRAGVNANDLVWRIARVATRVGLWPELSFAEPWIPADVAGDAIVDLALARAAASPARAFHLVHTGRVHLDAVRAALVQLGFPLTTVSPMAFAAAVRERGAVEDQPLAAFFEQATSVPPLPAAVGKDPDADAYSCRELLSHLPADHDARPVDAGELAAQCHTAIRMGILPDPLSTHHP